MTTAEISPFRLLTASIVISMAMQGTYYAFAIKHPRRKQTGYLLIEGWVEPSETQQMLALLWASTVGFRTSTPTYILLRCKLRGIKPEEIQMLNMNGLKVL